jgi:hypothetical protein
MRSSDLHVGDFVQLPTPQGVRRVEIIKMDDGGFTVKWFSPEGLGPYVAVLPHGTFPHNTLHKQLYADERAGKHESYWTSHSDFTGRTREF